MDYAIQLLAVVGLFLFGGLWLKDNAGLPMWGVIAMFFTGVIAGMWILYKRSSEEGQAAQQRYEAEKHNAQENENKSDD